MFGRRRCSSRTVALLAVGLIVTPGLASGASLDKRELEARRDFAEARYEEALHLFAELFAQVGDVIYLRNIARCYQKMRRPTEAIATFHDYLAKAKVSEKEQREIESFIREMEELEKELAADARSRAGVPDGRSPHPADTPSSAINTPDPRVVPGSSAAPKSSSAVATTTAMSPTGSPGLSLVVATPESQPRRLQWAGIATGAAGAVLVAVGLGFSLATRSAEHFVEHDYSPARDAEGRRDETLQWIGYLTGGAALATGTALFIVGRTAARSEGPNVQAAVGPQGLRLGMRF